MLEIYVKNDPWNIIYLIRNEILTLYSLTEPKVVIESIDKGKFP